MSDYAIPKPPPVSDYTRDGSQWPRHRYRRRHRRWLRNRKH